jgi:hypothetical protein
MNSELKPRIFDIPQNILDMISRQISSLNGQHVHGLHRAQRLLTDKSVKYGQLKRIINDLQTIDKVKEKQRYDLFGGYEMEKWASPFLQGERNLISARQDSKQQAQNIAGTGEEKNSHLKKHSKKPDSLTSMNMVKSSPHKASISAAGSLKLFEEVEKIKKLML